MNLWVEDINIGVGVREEYGSFYIMNVVDGEVI